MRVGEINYALPHGNMNGLDLQEVRRANYLAFRRLPAMRWGQGPGLESEVAVPLGPEASPAWLIYHEGRVWTVENRGWNPYANQHRLAWHEVQRDLPDELR